MAVELLITNKKTGASKLVPVATSQVFRDYWKVGSTALDLRLVPLLEDGLWEQKDIPSLIIELGQLRDWFQKSHPLPTGGALAIRAENVLAAFQRVLEDPELTIG